MGDDEDGDGCSWSESNTMRLKVNAMGFEFCSDYEELYLKKEKKKKGRFGKGRDSSRWK